jgi:predicted nucleic acid-binding protein
MILVDSSVWIDHLRIANPVLAEQLIHNAVLMHPFVIGELALGSLRQREVILAALRDLPPATVAQDAEVASFIEAYRLFGLGVGYIDAHLLASVRLMPGSSLWTRDRRLNDIAAKLGVAANLA